MSKQPKQDLNFKSKQLEDAFVSTLGLFSAPTPTLLKWGFGIWNLYSANFSSLEKYFRYLQRNISDVHREIFQIIFREMFQSFTKKYFRWENISYEKKFQKYFRGKIIQDVFQDEFPLETSIGQHASIIIITDRSIHSYHCQK